MKTYSMPSDVPTRDLFIPTILERVPVCPRHKHLPHQACFVFSTLAGDWQYGICNERAIRAGYNNPIDPRSLQTGRKNLIKKNSSK